MKYHIDDIPQKQLDLLGVTKRDILNLTPRTYEALMAGRQTSLLRFNNVQIEGLQGTPIDMKLSLKKGNDGKPSLRFTPIAKVAKNVFQLSEKEIETLRKGKAHFVEKNLAKGPHLVALDKETNQYIAIKKDQIEAPEMINGYKLTDKQAKDFKEGKDIELGGEKFRLEPASELGIEAANKKSSVRSLNFKHSRYTAPHLLLDLALLTSGAGGIMVIGHLVNILMNSKIETKNPEENRLREGLSKAAPEIMNAFEKGEKLTPKELKKMIENHLDRPIDVEAIENDMDFKQGYPTGVNVTVVDENKTEEVREEHIEDIQVTTAKPGANPDEVKEERADKVEEVKQEPQKKFSIRM